MVEFARSKDAFSESFELEASSVKSQSLSRKDHKRSPGEKNEQSLISMHALAVML